LRSGEKMEKRGCQLCVFVFVEEKGDPDSGLEPGTKFEDLPRDWVCPVCGAEKDQFKRL
jgi:rubredoxin